ncbi:hypothetical protein GGX14DRAFT_411561 [Mycena pura]|uniref:Uncharacterized protein n=1 Tax=Mycena pura TaxID=153505 RepID=A0AAD6YVX0_9AGAR|nr:hypothetical protein GGX14DRAFT_411561 [Mycena pura]
MSLYYTWSTGKDLVLKDYRHFRKTQQHHLFQSGVAIVEAYKTLITLLRSENHTPHAIRLQNALAAAVQDVPLKTFCKLDNHALEDLRYQTNRLYDCQTAPAIIVHMGGPRSQRTLPRSPSTSTQLIYATLQDIEREFSERDADEDLDGSPWSEAWDAEEGPWPCHWGWHTRTQDEKSHYIFLSGAYVVWPHRWESFEAEFEPSKQKAALYTHLKITLFHELSHYSRTALHGRLKHTSEKVVDDARHARNGVGEGGRLAETLAFGCVVDMFMAKSQIYLFVTDSEAPAGTGDFELDERTQALLFFGDSPPIDLERLSQSPKHRLMNVPDFARSKAGGACQDTLVAVRIVGPQRQHSPIIQAPLPHPSGLTLITGELSCKIQEQRANIDWMKRCVETE